MKHIIIDFKFDMKAFADTLKSVSESDLNDFAAVIGIDHSTLRNWRIEGAKGKYAMPSMRNFINACNWLDLDPREFFVLVEDEKEQGCEYHGAETITMSSIVGTLNHGETKIVRDSVLCKYCGEVIRAAEYTEVSF